jgi:hypothetical protein
MSQAGTISSPSDRRSNVRASGPGSNEPTQLSPGGSLPLERNRATAVESADCALYFRMKKTVAVGSASGVDHCGVAVRCINVAFVISFCKYPEDSTSN